MALSKFPPQAFLSGSPTYETNLSKYWTFHPFLFGYACAQMERWKNYDGFSRRAKLLGRAPRECVEDGPNDRTFFREDWRSSLQDGKAKKGRETEGKKVRDVALVVPSRLLEA